MQRCRRRWLAGWCGGIIRWQWSDAVACPSAIVLERSTDLPHTILLLPLEAWGTFTSRMPT
jgi:hypothetical protein